MKGSLSLTETDRPKILVIEDEDATRYAQVWALSRGNFDVIEASSGREGLSKLSQHPDLIILDISLPDMSGFELCQIIKQNPQTSSIPVLHMSACFSTPADKIQGLEMGADAYLVHPVEVPELLATVNALLRMRRSEASAKYSANLWESTFNAIRDGVCVLNHNNELVRGNSAFSRIFPDWRVSTGINDLIPGLFPDKGETGRKEIMLGERWFEVEVTTLTDIGKVCTLRNVTERLTAQRELQLAKRNAEEANLSKSRFLANMSHEIRTPLGAIMGFTDVLREGDATADEREKFLETIHRNGRNLMLLIDDILDLSKVEADKMDYQSVPVTLDALVKDVMESLNFQAFNKNVSLFHEIHAASPETIISDPSRLRQILINIVGNAVKFTKDGSVKIFVHSTPELVIFDVEDTGRGVKWNDIQKLFQPFSQGDSTTTREFGGTGLGLVLSRKLANGLGGDVVLLRSEENMGSTFRISIRFTPTDLKPLSIEPKWEPKTRLENLKVLVVDDSPDNRMLLKRILQKHKILVTEVENGLEALKVADDFELILLDIQMPVLDGYETMKRLKTNGYRGRVIALTAHAMQEERQRCLSLGCSDYLTKPIDIEVLLQTLARQSRI